MVTSLEQAFPVAADPVSVAKDLADRVRELADRTESERMVPNELTDAFFERGLYSLLVPTALGGGTAAGDATPRQVLDVLETLAAADGSTAWALMASMSGMGATYATLSDEGVATLLGSQNMITAGESTPGGTAKRVDGGHIVSGRFRYASGSNAAGWFTGGYSQTSADGSKSLVAALVPREKVELLGNWEVMGLVGTASVDYEINEQFVPDALVRSSQVLRGDVMHSAGLRSLTTLGHTGVLLGLMRGALDEFAEFARGKSRPPGGLLARQEAMQRDYGRWWAQYRAVRGFALDAFATVYEVTAAGGKAAPQQEADCRLAATHAAYVATDITQAVYLAAGGDSLRTNGAANRLQRFFRDSHGASQHMLTGAHVYVEAGRIQLDPPGLPDVFMRPFQAVFAPPVRYEHHTASGSS